MLNPNRKTIIKRWLPVFAVCLLLGRAMVPVSATQADADIQEQETEETAETEATKETEENEAIEAEEEIIAVTDIEISNHEDSLAVGETMTLTATVLPANATDSTITYTSSNKAVATVNSSGEVKGISKGSVTITASAGEVTVSIPLNIVVSTTKISVNSNYLVLKTGATFQISAAVSPSDAPQALSYKSLDADIATVSSSGLVTAKTAGSTSVVVSNGDQSVAISVMVNESTSGESSEGEASIELLAESGYTSVVYANATALLDADLLKYLYDNQMLLSVVGDGYLFTVDGAQIENYHNEMQTDIALVQSDEGISFCINGGDYLCGPIILYLDEVEGKYLYLYNASKEKYELLATDSLEEIVLTSPGEYQIVSEKIRKSTVKIKWIIIGGGLALGVGICVYVGMKKKYWFW